LILTYLLAKNCLNGIIFSGVRRFLNVMGGFSGHARNRIIAIAITHSQPPTVQDRYATTLSQSAQACGVKVWMLPAF
jgi:hypothetical protein